MKTSYAGLHACSIASSWRWLQIPAASEPMFSLEERVAMAEQVVGDVPGVEITGYEGLTVAFAEANELNAIVRGLRAVSDFEYEFQLAAMNRHLTKIVETVFLTPTEEYAFISSTLVKEVATLGGDISEFVSSPIREAMLARVAEAGA
jgi:pantetheine-phosphate adenylyltransferase